MENRKQKNRDQTRLKTLKLGKREKGKQKNGKTGKQENRKTGKQRNREMGNRKKSGKQGISPKPRTAKIAQKHQNNPKRPN